MYFVNNILFLHANGWESLINTHTQYLVCYGICKLIIFLKNPTFIRSDKQTNNMKTGVFSLFRSEIKHRVLSDQEQFYSKTKILHGFFLFA